MTPEVLLIRKVRGGTEEVESSGERNSGRGESSLRS